jgi:hypothetical protein
MITQTSICIDGKKFSSPWIQFLCLIVVLICSFLPFGLFFAVSEKMAPLTNEKSWFTNTLLIGFGVAFFYSIAIAKNKRNAAAVMLVAILFCVHGINISCTVPTTLNQYGETRSNGEVYISDNDGNFVARLPLTKADLEHKEERLVWEGTSVPLFKYILARGLSPGDSLSRAFIPVESEREKKVTTHPYPTFLMGSTH